MLNYFNMLLMKNYSLKLILFILTIILFQNYLFAAVTVLGKGDASLCYQTAELVMEADHRLSIV